MDDLLTIGGRTPPPKVMSSALGPVNSLMKKRSQGNNKSKESVKIMVNLEDAFIQEQRLWKVLEAVRKHDDPMLYCSLWDEISNDSAIKILHRFFREKRLKEEIQFASKTELISVSLARLFLSDDDGAHSLDNFGLF